MFHPAGWEEASLDGKTLFAGFAGTHDVGCSFQTVSTRGGADVRCQRELCDPARAASWGNKHMQAAERSGESKQRKRRYLKRSTPAETADKVRALVGEKPDLTIT